MGHNALKVLVTGGHGFVGHAVLSELINRGHDYYAPSKDEYDLTNQQQVSELFKSINPTHVIHLAGKVGGIWANKNEPATFFYQNSLPGILVMHAALNFGVNKFVGLAAGCGYPKVTESPFKEEDFWKGFPDENSYAYSMGKKNLIIQGMAYKEQYGFNSTILLPANLYGPWDNFSKESSHVVPGLIRKFSDAKKNGDPTVEVWGSGEASREFLYVKDCAKAIVDAVLNPEAGVGPYNLGTGTETKIKELIEGISSMIGYEGNVVWDRSKPDGQLRRYYDMSKFSEDFGYIPATPLKEGLEKTIHWFEENRNWYIEEKGY